MTALSLTAGYSDRAIFSSVVPHSVSALAARATTAVDQASSRASDWAFEHLLDAAGGMTLALAPFSLLAWVFIAN